MKANLPLLYRAARQGVYGEYRRFERGGIADALFVYLTARPTRGAPRSSTRTTGRGPGCA